MPNKETSAPLFRFSRHLWYSAVVTLALGLLTIILRAEQEHFGQLATPFVGLSLFITIVYGLSLLRFFHSVRDARFYVDHLTVKGWRTNRRIDYDKVEVVTQHKSRPIWSGPLQLRVFVMGEVTPLVISSIRIPENKQLDTDLYSWLSERVQSLHRASSHSTDSQETEPLSSQEAICVVSSSSLRRHGESYAVVIAPTRIVGSSQSAWAADYSVYLGHGSQATEAERKEAYGIAQEVMKTNDLQLRRDSILQVGYRAPGSVALGYLIFRTVDGEVELNLAPIASDVGFREVLGCLLRALLEFAPDIVRDERSGVLMTAVDL